jgi:hypothetical protein
MKGFKVYGLVATLAAMAVCASALAQDGPPQGGQGGPPDMQGQGMRGPGRRMGPPPEPLVLRPDVQKELKLSDDQIKKLRSIMRPPMGGGPGGPDGGPGGGAGQGRGQGRRGPGGQGGQGGPPQSDDQGGPPNGGQGGPPQDDMGGPPRGGQDGGPDQMGPRGEGPGGGGPQAMDGKLKDVLNEGQMKRLKQLQLQRMGAEALSRPEIADKVGLSDDELDKVRSIVDDARQDMPRPEQGHQPDREKMMKAHQAMVAKVNDKVFAILSSKEFSKWKELTGKPFKFDENYRPEPPRREGGDGGEGR